MKTYNIYNIKDPKVINARKCLAHAIKYLCETERRKKGEYVMHRDPFGPYNSYIMAFNDLSRKYTLHPLDKSPDEFFKALIADEIDLSEVVREFMIAVARYLVEDKGHDVKVVFLPFYFEQSFERFHFPEQAHKHYFDYVRETLIEKFNYSLEELASMLMEEECLKNEFNAFEEVAVSDFYDDDNNGYIHGVHFGTFTKNRESIDIDVRWFKKEDERQTFIGGLSKEGFVCTDAIA